MFMPNVTEMYPNGHDLATKVEVPTLSDLLCGEYRPGHFQGVATVVAKLFNIVQPDVAIFGEKDFQQLTVLKRMTLDLCLPIQVIGAPTVREPDGLALSSRNQYLTSEERQLAPQIYRCLQTAAQAIAGGQRDFVALEHAGAAALTTAGFRPDYFAIRRAIDLLTPKPDDRELVILVAARLGKARLIDNHTVTVR
jgi:pantoate--beta-alanine ligase